jgi:hypothetical protein
MLLIITSPDDVHADAAEVELRRRGAEYLRFDMSSYPARAAIRVEHGPRASTSWLTIDGRDYPLHEMTAAWFRRPSRPTTTPQREAWMTGYATRESEQLLTDLWTQLPARWLPGPQWTIRRAGSKHLQLATARQVGLAIPPTLVTTDPAALRRFYREHDGRIIDKAPSSLLARERSNDFVRYTELVNPRDLVYAERLRSSPMLFQAYVPKRSELRVTVVGERVFAGEIQSQVTNRTRHDWRRFDHGHTPHRAHTLPPAVEASCVAIVRALGLAFGAIDLVLTPDGEYVFLEVNPNGQYLWIEHLTGLPITAAIVDHLLAEDQP